MFRSVKDPIEFSDSSDEEGSVTSLASVKSMVRSLAEDRIKRTFQQTRQTGAVGGAQAERGQGDSADRSRLNSSCGSDSVVLPGPAGDGESSGMVWGKPLQTSTPGKPGVSLVQQKGGELDNSGNMEDVKIKIDPEELAKFDLKISKIIELRDRMGTAIQHIRGKFRPSDDKVVTDFMDGSIEVFQFGNAILKRYTAPENPPDIKARMEAVEEAERKFKQWKLNEQAAISARSKAADAAIEARMKAVEAVEAQLKATEAAAESSVKNAEARHGELVEREADFGHRVTERKAVLKQLKGQMIEDKSTFVAEMAEERSAFNAQMKEMREVVHAEMDQYKQATELELAGKRKKLEEEQALVERRLKTLGDRKTQLDADTSKLAKESELLNKNKAELQEREKQFFELEGIFQTMNDHAADVVCQLKQFALHHFRKNGDRDGGGRK